MTHDNTAAVLLKYQSLKSSIPKLEIKNSAQPVFTCDHNIQDTSNSNLMKYTNIQRFASDNRIDFYPPGRGIGHQIMIEQGYAFPQSICVASDSHSNMYGGIGCLGTPIVRTDACSIWATGSTWWKVPPIVRLNFTGSLPKHLTGKDLIISLCSVFDKNQVLNCAIEFNGTDEALNSLSIDDRLAIANMTTEWGALAGVFPVDKKTLDWIEARVCYFEHEHKTHGKFLDSTTCPSLSSGPIHPRYNRTNLAKLKENILLPDSGATYAKELHFDLGSLADSFVSGPNSVKIATSITELQKKQIKINKAYLVSCVNSRLSDIKQAAEVIEKSCRKKVAEGVEFYIAAASSEVQRDAEHDGYWSTLLNAGAKPLPPGCGPCIGLGKGLLKDNEVGISATNRNFRGRMGSPSALAYLASPAIVASSAINGYISSLDQSQSNKDTVFKYSIKFNHQAEYASQNDPVNVDGFPKVFEGNALYCNQDGLNTDGIYPGKYTYREDLTPEQMADVVMENYDPNFKNILKKDCILISRSNFGSGSSREQAATALLYSGIRVIVAKSFSETFVRNSLNNGLLCVECPQLVDDIHSYLSLENQKSIMTNIKIKAYPTKGKLEAYISEGNLKTYRFSKVGTVAQELLVSGGLENWIKNLVSSLE